MGKSKARIRHFSARYYTKDGERREKYFKSLPEAKNWLADTKYELRHRVIMQ